MAKPLPHSLEAERSILGAVLLDARALDVAAETLRAEHFFLDQHRRIYERMLELRGAQRAIDTLTVMDELVRHGELESSGGAAYLGVLLDGVPRISHVAHYARIVREKALLRDLVHRAQSIQDKALEAEEDADEILTSAEALVFQLMEERIRQGFVPAKDVVKGYIAALDSMLAGGHGITGLSTGYARLDELTLGLQDSELIILAARPSMGKTALALNIAENVSIRADEPRMVGVFSLEMSKESLLLRLLGANAPLDTHHLRAGLCTKADAVNASKAIVRIADALLWIDDAGSATVLELVSKARRLKHERGLSLVIVDYLQLLTHKTKFASRVDQVTEISRALKSMAKELRVPVLALSQLTRAPEREDRAPQLSDLRDSGSIEQDADVVLFIHRPHFFEKGASNEQRREAELIIAKQRNGPTDTVPFVFFEQHTRFEERAGF